MIENVKRFLEHISNSLQLYWFFRYQTLKVTLQLTYNIFGRFFFRSHFSPRKSHFWAILMKYLLVENVKRFLGHISNSLQLYWFLCNKTLNVTRFLTKKKSFFGHTHEVLIDRECQALSGTYFEFSVALLVLLKFDFESDATINI